TGVVHESQPDRLPADFRVKVEASAGMNLVSNGEKTEVKLVKDRQQAVFYAEAVRGFNLIGGQVTPWSELNDEAEVSIVLSDQFIPKYAKELVSNLHVNYKEVSKIAKLLNPAISYPDTIQFVLADYPSRWDISGLRLADESR